MNHGSYEVEAHNDGQYTLTVQHPRSHAMSYAHYLKQAVDAEAPQKAKAACGRCYSNAQVGGKNNRTGEVPAGNPNESKS